MGPAITGLGFSVPGKLRTNDDPVFAWIKQNHPAYADSFKGFRDRRILAEGKALSALMSRAALAALADAGVAADEVGLILGLGSVGPLTSPNVLAEVHRDVGLPRGCQIIPLETEHTVFNDALVVADAMLRSRPGLRNALVVCGCDWSRHVSYHEATCIGAADGAGAAVVSLTDDPSCFRVVDSAVETDTSFVGAMRMAARATGIAEPAAPYDPTLYTTPLMYYGEEAQKAFQTFGVGVPPRLIAELLARNALSAAEICLIAHQASSVLTDAWLSAVGPGQFLTTIESYANMTIASVPVTLASRYGEIETSRLVLLTLGMQQQASAVLLARDPLPS
ncbi:hypothetical protein [Lichenibacterium dinghuense]|uniref:hypothetical protein n=1 Tax=Lichenibacterium dinghuense TaxID=2895977 RepID=UPI001F3C6855|nr:hypothetical protein [Lichenibacterium sp. 6Y81]